MNFLRIRCVKCKFLRDCSLIFDLKTFIFRKKNNRRMWIEWLTRYSIAVRKWPLKFLCDECKRHRYMLSFSPLLFVHHRNVNIHALTRANEEYHHRNQSSRQRTLFASSILGALASAATIFSWENDGISDEEL